MNLSRYLKEISLSALESLKLAWWLEITTEKPHCIYYFGPFACASEAVAAQSGYIEDLENELAQIITVNLQRCHPQLLTVSADE